MNGFTKWLVGALWTIALAWAAWASNAILDRVDVDEFVRHENRVEKQLESIERKLDDALRRRE